jgi:hypothetical protein
MFLADDEATDIESLNAISVHSNFRPATTTKNWHGLRRGGIPQHLR